MSNKYTDEQYANVIAKILSPREVVAFRADLARLMGVNSALFLSQCIYWYERAGNFRGIKQFYKNQQAKRDKNGKMIEPDNALDQSFEYETGLTLTQQNSARKILEGNGFLITSRLGTPAKLYYSLDLNKIAQFLLENMQDTSRIEETSNQESRKPRIKNRGSEESRVEETNNHTNTKSTTENTQITQQLQPAKNAGVVEVDDVNKISREKTMLALKAQYQIPDVNASNKDFIDLCELGLVTQDFLDAASTINDKSKRKFNYVLKVAKSRLNEASKSPQKPSTSGKSKAREHGKEEMPKWIKDLNLEENIHLYE